MSQKSEIRDGMMIEWDVPITMDDGLVLRADVFRPPQEGKYPVIMSYGVYGKYLAFREGYPNQWKKMAEQHPDVLEGSTNQYQNWEVTDPEKWVPHGYAVIRVDARGAGRSPGFLSPHSIREARDYYHCIEWAGTQSWSGGKVGLLGISYYAINQWRVAALQPPHLAAIIPWEGNSDFYREATYNGGIFNTFARGWFKRQVLTVQHGVGNRGRKHPVTGELVAGPETLTEEELARNRADSAAERQFHKLFDEYHREKSPDLSKVVVPLLSAGNWGGQGLHLRGNVEGFVRAGSKQKWLEIHGLEHWTEFYTRYGVTLQRRFFDHFLKGIDNDWKDQPRVQLQVRTVKGFVQRGENEWPLARTHWTRLYLNPAERSLSREPVKAEESITYEGLGDGLTFMTPPLKEETEITGPVAAKLFVSSSTTDADLFLVLRVFDPDGNEVVFQGAIDPHTPIGQGWLRASHRKLDPKLSTEYRPYHPHDLVEPLKPGDGYELDVEIWPTCMVVPPGYRIGLTVRGKDFEYTGEGPSGDMKGCGHFLHNAPEDRPPEIFGGKVTLYAGGDRTGYVLLPIIPKK